MDFKMYDDMTIEELYEAKQDVYGAIQNEKFWMFGSAGDKEAECMHAENVDQLREELQYIFDLIEKRENGNEALG